MDPDIVTPTPRAQPHRRSRTQRLFSSTGGGRVDEPRAVPVNLRKMTVRELEPYFAELAPLARYHCSHNYEETLTLTVHELLTQKRPRGSDRLIVSQAARHQINDSLAGIYAFARAYTTRFPQLRDTDAYLDYARDASTILADWEARTNALLVQIAQHPRTQADTLLFEGEIRDVRLPTQEEWARVHAMTATVFEHASRHANGDELRVLCQSILSNYCAQPCIEAWLAASDGLGAFRYHLQCNRGHALDNQWSTGTWSEIGHAWHPELAQHTFLVLKDMAVPLPWRGLGFSRLLRNLERKLVVHYDTVRVHGLFLHHVHRDMLAITLGRAMHGYHFWAHPFPDNTPAARPGDDDNNFRQALVKCATEDILNGINRTAKPWMYAVTETYGSDPERGEVFHLYWLTPVGTRLAASRTLATGRVLVPLTVLQRPLAAFAQLTCAFIRSLETTHESPVCDIELPCTSAARTAMRMRLCVSSQQLFQNNTNWALSLCVVPSLNAYSDSMVDSPLYMTQVALLDECIKCLCDTFVYADVAPASQPVPPLVVQLRIALSDECFAEDSATLTSDLSSLLGERLMDAAEDDQERATLVVTIHNPQKRH